MFHPDACRKHYWTYGALLAVLVIVTIAIYWAGLHGPVLLDDVPNLAPVTGWLNGDYSWQYVVFGNTSGPLGRPLSMATFLLDAAVTHSTGSFAFKPTNLLIHVLCGLAVLWLACQVFRRWRPTELHAGWLAMALMAWWLWLPLNVDTVLYIVQRMAQLSALFTLLALGCYMMARAKIARGLKCGRWLLWVGVPVLTALAALSKENGVLALPLALVLELFLFGNDGQRRPASVKLFFLLAVGVPALAGAVFVALDPNFITAGYAGREFTLAERLLTEPRVLWHYVQTLLVPVGSYMGFFQDNFPVSAGLLAPRTTLLAILAWIALGVSAWLWHRVNPLYGAGVFFFLVGQSMESSVIPLEIYFEHRNYLPSFGVLLAVIGVLVWAWQRIPAPTRTFRTICAALCIGALSLYAAATWGHVQSWRSEKTFLYAQNVLNPTSPRFRGYIVALALQNHDLPAALQFIALAEQGAPPSQYSVTPLWRLLAYCSADTTPPAELYGQFAQRAHGPITVPVLQAMSFLAGAAVAKCPGLDNARLAAVTEHWLDSVPAAATSRLVWQTRDYVAQIVAAGGQLKEARNLLDRAWVDSGYDSDVGMFLFQLNGSLGDVAACRKILRRLERQTGRGDLQLDRAVAVFRKALARGEITPVSATSTARPLKE